MKKGVTDEQLQSRLKFLTTVQSWHAKGVITDLERSVFLNRMFPEINDINPSGFAYLGMGTIPPSKYSPRRISEGTAASVARLDSRSVSEAIRSGDAYLRTSGSD